MKRAIVLFVCLCNNFVFSFERAVIILGPPASGKSTQIQLLTKALGWPVPIIKDDGQSKYKTWIKLDKEKIMMSSLNNHDQKEIVYDNWPKTGQALKSLLLKRDKITLLVIELVVRDETILQRVPMRKQCPRCRTSYGPARLEKIANICDECNNVIVVRPNDNFIYFSRRLLNYKEQQKEFRKAYEEQGISVHKIDAEGDPQRIHDCILRLVLEKL